MIRCCICVDRCWRLIGRAATAAAVCHCDTTVLSIVTVFVTMHSCLQLSEVSCLAFFTLVNVRSFYCPSVVGFFCYAYGSLPLCFNNTQILFCVMLSCHRCLCNSCSRVLLFSGESFIHKLPTTSISINSLWFIFKNSCCLCRNLLGNDRLNLRPLKILTLSRLSLCGKIVILKAWCNLFLLKMLLNSHHGPANKLSIWLDRCIVIVQHVVICTQGWIAVIIIL